MSSSSESDDEYVPEEPEKLSEEDSADDETENQYENEVDSKGKKRKSEQISKGKKKMKAENGIKNINKNVDLQEEESEKISATVEEDKKREDDLWAKFLEGTETKPTPPVKETSKIQSSPIQSGACSVKSKSFTDTKRKVDEKKREQKIFEFAGETIVVENNVIQQKDNTSDSPASASKILTPISKSRGGGLSDVLSQINKKNTLSTLEKSKLDWNKFKKDEGIEEEIVSHNKGKAGYLDRQDFLERTDVRQYELERDLRLGRRSKR